MDFIDLYLYNGIKDKDPKKQSLFLLKALGAMAVLLALVSGLFILVFYLISR